MTVSPDTVAAWMVSELEKSNCLYQIEVADKLRHEHGDEATYINSGGNVAISNEILTAFNKLTGNGVVWVRSGRYWRRREAGDIPGRQQ